jgi:dATP/dGTP diphosphohydrolase
LTITYKWEPFRPSGSPGEKGPEGGPGLVGVPTVAPEAGDHLKLDHGKLPWHLLPWDAVEGIVKVLAYGARKYAPRGWEEGMDWSRVDSALTRHLTDWRLRRGVDPDTGFSHLWHAGCCILFLIAYEMRGSGKDDRPNLA